MKTKGQTLQDQGGKSDAGLLRTIKSSMKEISSKLDKKLVSSNIFFQSGIISWIKAESQTQR